MKIIIWLISGCMSQISVCAADFYHDYAPASPLSYDFFTSYSLTENLQILTRDQRRVIFEVDHFDRLGRPIDSNLRVSPLALAIEGAAKKGFIERGIEMSSEALILCQKETSPALTVAYLRSDSQQAHCFRF